MLTKAILTGGALSLLAGFGVYFGTEGAGALENNTPEAIRVEDTELAGAADISDRAAGADDMVAEEVSVDEVALQNVAGEEIVTAEGEDQDPPRKAAKPKTKWLDQYLKKTKPDAGSDDPVSEKEVEMSSEVGGQMTKEAPVADIDTVDLDKAAPILTEEQKADVKKSDPEERARIRKEKWMERKAARGEAKGRFIVKNEKRVETVDLDEDIDIQALKDQLGLDSDKNVEIRVIKKMRDGKSMSVSGLKTRTPTDYAPILVEAKKLLVIDMRNQAFLEIIDHAVDQDDVIQAADIVEELSTPELRDTARARIGTGLARRGDTDAAFAVLEEIEIDELAAPIRLEIITALMATKQERKNYGSQR